MMGRAAAAGISRNVRSAGAARQANSDVQGLRVQRLPLSAGTARIRVAGELDLATAGMLHDVIAGALAERPARLVVDLEDVTFAGSQLVHALEAAQNLMGDRRTGLRVVRPSRSVMRVLAICDLDHLCSERP
jgi:anti-anti-sigma factor